MVWKKKLLMVVCLLFLLTGPAYAVINSASVSFSNFGTNTYNTGDQNGLFQDDFSDATLSPFSTLAGTWTAASNRLENTSVVRSVSNADLNDVDFTGIDLNISILFHPIDATDEMYAGITDTSGDIRATGNSYILFVGGGASAVQLIRVDSGSDTTLISATGVISGGTDYTVLATRSSAGVWTLYLNGAQQGSPISDTNHNSYSNMGVSYDGAGSGTGGWFDNFDVNTSLLQTDSYVNQLNYTITYNCASVDANVQFAVDDVNKEAYSLNCNGSNNQITDSYTDTDEGLFNTKFWSIDINNAIQTIISDENFISDLNAPTIDINFSSVSGGFSDSTSTINAFLTCNDNISPILNYDLNNSSSNTNFLNSSDDANKTLQGSGGAINGTNIFVGACRDLAGNLLSDSNTITTTVACFNLVDEKTGVDWVGSDINTQFTSLTATAYSDGNTYNFSGNSDNDICYTATQDDTIRFDINYLSGLGIYREFNMDLVNDLNLGSGDLNVCLATDQDFFEQLFQSATQRKVTLINEITNCYSVIDYTKYSYGDTLSTRGFTIQMPYSLETEIDGETVILALINGAVESTINLDVLVFRSQDIDLGIEPDEISVSIYKPAGITDSNTVKIYYNNLATNNVSTLVEIQDENSVVLYSNTVTSTPNQFTLFFDTTTSDINADILKIVVTKTLTDGTVETLTKYFTMAGSSGSIGAPIAAMLAILIVFFGLTIVRYTLAFNWFGILVVLIGIGILAYAPAAGYIIWLEAMLMVAALYIFMVYKDETVRTT